MLHHSGKAELGYTRFGWPQSQPWCLGPGPRPHHGEKHLWKPVRAFSYLALVGAELCREKQRHFQGPLPGSSQPAPVARSPDSWSWPSFEKSKVPCRSWAVGAGGVTVGQAVHWMKVFLMVYSATSAFSDPPVPSALSSQP